MTGFKLFSVLFFAVASLATAMPSAPTVGASPIDGFDVVPLTWTGAVKEGGPEYTFSGTAKDIIDQILEVNPSFPLVSIPDNTNITIAEIDGESLIDCNPSDDWHPAAEKQLLKEAGYLKSLGDQPCNAGPGDCVRVSCSYNTAVYMCNLRYEDWGPPCSTVGDIVVSICDDCSSWDPKSDRYLAAAVASHPGDYKIWAGEAHPNC